MSRLALAGCLLLGLSAAARAADLPLKAPPVPVPAWSWSGFYLGVNGGYSFGSDPFTSTVNGQTSATASVVTPHGGLFGGQAGYNWQFGNLVVGVEGDAQWTGQKDTSCGLDCFFDNTTDEFTAKTVRHKLDWLATARARFGWANDGYLLYVTGGPAWGRVHEMDSLFFDGVPTNIANFSNTLNGWAFGGGVEARLWGNWTAKLEYLHIDLGSMTNNAALPQLCGPVLCAGPFTLSTTSAVRDDIVRVGVNYQFAAVPGATTTAVWLPVKAPTRVWDWAGPYIGLNAGYGVGGDPFNGLVTVGGVPFSSTFANANVAPSGGLFGGQVGYNWQIEHIVFGVEADAQWTNQQGASCGQECNPAFNPATYVTINQKLDWFATARGRLGWAHDAYLLYATGGAAWGGIQETDAFPALPAAATFSQTRTGWTAGAGVEARLWRHWTGKLEYLHLDLGSTTNAFTFGAGPAVLTTTSAIRDDIVRAGLNYRFGS